jgi:phosphonate transport system substrate-binding protein
MKMKRLMIKLIILCQFVALCFSFTARAEEPLTLWVHPYLPATELIKKFTPLADYLSEKCGKTIQVRVSKSYKSHIERVGEERIDLAYLGPASFVKVINTYGEKILLARLEVNGSPFFHGMIIARQDSPITTLDDLTGKSFAFGDPNSTMSHLVPRYMLLEAGVSIDNFKKLNFLGSHNNVALGVLGGYYDAGGLKEGVYYKYRERGLKSLAKSPPISEHLFVASTNLSQSTINILRQAMFELKDSAILTPIKPSVSGLVPVKDEDYDYLFSVLKHLNKLKAE